MNENFEILIKRLKLFRKKYYLFKFLRGLILSLIFSFTFYLLISLIEYYSFLPSSIRTFLFYAFILFNIFIIIEFVLIPFFLLINLLKQIGFHNVNEIIVKHFPEIKDRLLNIIELSKTDEKLFSSEIIWASIDQKIEEIKLFSFENAINFSKLKYFIFYLSFCLFCGLIIFIVDRPILTESNYRIINYKENFSKPAPFKFVLVNKFLTVKRGDSYLINVTCNGTDLPQSVYINIEGNNYLMKKEENNKFIYRIESVTNDINFYFTDLKFKSNYYFLSTISKPNISEFDVKIIPPKYTNVEKGEFKNLGDLKIPEGTEIEWNFKCTDTDSLFIRFNELYKEEGVKKGNLFSFAKKILETDQYSIFIKNINIEYEEVLSYMITTIPDLYPEIKVRQTRDSMQFSLFYFEGEIMDDYGFNDLSFHLVSNNHDSIFPLEIVHNLKAQRFYYLVDFNTLNIGSNDVTYYFSVTDNDGVNGSKTTTSNSFVYKAPTFEEIREYDNKQFSNIEKLMDEGRNLSSEMKEQLKELQKKSLDPLVSQWEKTQLANSIINNQNRLEQIVNNVKKQNTELNNFTNTYTRQNEEILEKQEMIEKLLDQVFSDELKSLFDELKKLSEEFNGERLRNISEKLNLSYDDLSKQLDRNLELLKRMKTEQKFEDVIKKISELSDKELLLSKQIEDDRNFDKVLTEDNNNLENFRRIKKELSDALDLNNDLKRPLNFDNFEDEFNNILEDFNRNNEYLNKENKNKSGQSLKSTSEHLKNLAFNMQQLLKSNNLKQEGEDIDNIKQILSNLLYFSFTQEDIMAQFGALDLNNPNILNLKRKQKNLKDLSLIISDSLYALSNRTPQISNLVNNELININLNLSRANRNLDEGSIAESKSNQQFIVTSANNLSLLLNEALINLETEMAKNMDGNQECEKPGQGKTGKNMNMLKQTAEGLKQQLQQMIEELKKGKKSGINKMLGQSLMQHEKMQEMLRELVNDGTIGSQAKNELKEIDKLLEQTRQELINKNIADISLIRQNQIRTRLLDAEKSEREKDFEESRKSNTAEELFYSNPIKYFEFEKKATLGLENIVQDFFKVNDFYNKKYKAYISQINK